MSRARIVLGAVEPAPRALEDAAAAALVGGRLEDDAVAEAARSAAASCDALGDRNVDAATRRDLVRALVRDALLDVRAEAEAAA